MDLGDGVRVKASCLECVLKLELEVFASTCGKKTKAKDNSKVLGLNSWMDGVSIHCSGEYLKKHGIRSYQKHDSGLLIFKIPTTMFKRG